MSHGPYETILHVTWSILDMSSHMVQTRPAYMMRGRVRLSTCLNSASAMAVTAVTQLVKNKSTVYMGKD